MADIIGTIHPKNAMYIHEVIGTANNNEGAQYEMMLVNGHIPAIRSKTTGKHFLLGWQDILALAIKAGVDKEDE